jgi:hypothetical protein
MTEEDKQELFDLINSGDTDGNSNWFR